VFSPRWFPTPTASLSSSVSTSSASLASVSHLRSTNSSSSSQPPPTYNWQTNLLLLGGAGSLLKSAYGTNNKNNEEQQSITRCDNTEAEPTTTKDPKDNDDDDDDDETHCTICLINRQGPCRTVWRTFERCMKDHSKQQQDDDDDASPVSGMGEKCDGHMMPWITCIQSHRNTYTLISNKFFGDEFVDVVEKGIAEQDKVCLGDSGGDGSSSSSSIDWKQFVEFQTDGWLDDESEEAKSEQPVVVATGEDGDADAILVEGVARINLWDSDGTRRIDLAYVRDQDGLLLGHERFTTSKAAMDDETSRGGGEGGGDDTGETTKEGTTTTGDDNKIEEENGNTNNDRTNNNKSDSIRSKITVGHCSFHVSPGSTKAIQIFALYGSKDKSDEFGNSEDDVDQKKDFNGRGEGN